MSRLSYNFPPPVAARDWAQKRREARPKVVGRREGRSLYKTLHGLRRILRIVVEAASGLLSHHAGLHHAFEERRRREARLAQLVEHDVGDEVGSVETDEVEQRE